LNFFSASYLRRRHITIKITCCIQRQNYKKELTTFSKINFALEELRQVDFARYNKKSKALLLLVSLLFFSLSNSVAVVRVSFSALNSANIKPQFWLFLLFRFVPVFATDFEKLTSYFSTSNPAFSPDYIHRIELTFFKSNWLHST